MAAPISQRTGTPSGFSFEPDESSPSSLFKFGNCSPSSCPFKVNTVSTPGTAVAFGSAGSG
eukprot:1909583-Pleurochrysis_carterae.AAC.1